MCAFLTFYIAIMSSQLKSKVYFYSTFQTMSAVIRNIHDTQQSLNQQQIYTKNNQTK